MNKSKTLAPDEASSPALDFLGVASLLPLDFMATPFPQTSVSKAINLLRAEGESWDPRRMPFPFRQAALAGGGKIGNQLAFLAGDGFDVAVCGAVGDDATGNHVLDDLKSYGVRTDTVRVVAEKPTRVLGIVCDPLQPGRRRQFSLNNRKLRFDSRWVTELPPANTIVLGRANRTVIKLAQARRTVGARIALCIPSVEWRHDGAANQAELLTLADIVMAHDSDLRKLAGVSDGPRVEVLIAMFEKAPLAKVVFAYDRDTNRCAALLAGQTEVIEAGPQPHFDLVDSTGAIDTTFAAFLSFLAKLDFEMTRPTVRAALGYAEECASFVRTGHGARFFPSVESREQARAKHKETIPVHTRCFVSHSHADKPVASWLREKLNQLPGTSVWLDDFHLMYGEEIGRAVEAAIAASNVFLVICSSRSASSKWVAREAKAAMAREAQGLLLFLPVILEGDPNANEHLHAILGQTDLVDALTVDLRDPSRRDEVVAKLARSLVKAPDIG